MRIALDAMGGDHAPDEIVRGAALAASAPGFSHEIVLVGDERRLHESLSSLDIAAPRAGLTVHHAPQTIEMHEHPLRAIKQKAESSLVVCGQMVACGQASATLSAGNTGAAMAVAALKIGRIDGVNRPAIATALPTARGRTLLVDAGANVDCSPQNLLQFGVMGSAYAERALHIPEPSVGLLSIGSEESKGNELTKAAFELLKRSPLKFHGNVEGKDVWEHTTDVVVCDGFVGNVLLKTAEGFAEWMTRMIMAEAQSGSADDRQAVERLLGRLLARIDYSEYGAAPLLGIRGVSMISHGRSRAKAIANAIRQTIDAAESGFVEATSERSAAMSAA